MEQRRNPERSGGTAPRGACSQAVTKFCLILLGLPLFAQDKIPTFEQYKVDPTFTGTPVQPLERTPEERRFRTVIRQGVAKGWGVEDGVTGQDLNRPGPNFAGHYAIVRWGCGSPCDMIAIVDLKNGRVFPPPFHGAGRNYFNFPSLCPDSVVCPLRDVLAYRLDSRLLVARGCEASTTGQREIHYQRCGPHYYVMTASGLRLVHRILEF